jgi:hypothetical protein
MMICVPSGRLFSRSRVVSVKAFEAEQRIVTIHAGPVVGDPNETAAASPDFDGDFFGVGIERILDEFLDDAGRSLDHFAGGNLVGDLFGEKPDAVHTLG